MDTCWKPAPGNETAIDRGGRYRNDNIVRSKSALLRTAALIAFACAVGVPLPRLVLSAPARPIAPPVALERIAYAHVVIECTINDVHQRGVTLAQLNIPADSPDRKVFISVADLSDVVVVRGYGSPTEVQVSNDLNLEKGQHVIMCCYWVPTLGMFSVPADRSVFLRDGDHWTGIRHAIGADPVSTNEATINTLVEESSMAVVTDKADVIVLGNVASVTDTVVVSGGHEYRADKVILNVVQSIKGDARSAEATFFVARDAERPSWFTVAPAEIRKGETWLVFLGRAGEILYPAAGVNGLLQIRGQDVFFDRAVKCPFSRTKLIGIVEAANESK